MSKYVDAIVAGPNNCKPLLLTFENKMSIKQLQEKWAPVLNHDALPEIADSHKRGVVAQLLETKKKQ